MMAYDFGGYYYAAQCFIQGQSPYMCAGFFYPLPTLFLFLPFVAFPYPVTRVLWWIVLLTVFVMMLRRRALWYAFYVPVLQAFYLGQVDMLLLPLVFSATGPAMALLTLKPQLIWLFLPIWFWGTSARERRRFLAISGGVWAASFVCRPSWPAEFLSTTRPIVQAAYASPSLWGGGVLPWWGVIPLGLALVIVARNRWAAATAANPALISYDLVILLPGARWWLVPLSWITQYAASALGMSAPHALLSVATALVPQQRHHPRPLPLWGEESGSTPGHAPRGRGERHVCQERRLW